MSTGGFGKSLCRVCSPVANSSTSVTDSGEQSAINRLSHREVVLWKIFMYLMFVQSLTQ